MKRIATLTVNPAIDKSTSVNRVAAERKLRCGPPRREPGGGGVNVSRAIQRLGGTSKLLYLAGGLTGEMLRELLDGEALDHEMIRTRGWTRENLIVREEETGEQFRFGMPGPDVGEDEWKRALSALASMRPAPDYLVASGSLAPGMPDDFYRQVAEVGANIGARVVVDTSGAALRQMAGGQAWLLKPNARELRDLAGGEPGDAKGGERAARRLIEEGFCSVVVLSLGSGGARVVTAQSSMHVRTPAVAVQSKVGAGDSMVGGLVLGLARGMPLMDAVRFGAAAGTAAVMTPGTELCRQEDTARLYEQVESDS